MICPYMGSTVLHPWQGTYQTCFDCPITLRVRPHHCVQVAAPQT